MSRSLLLALAGALAAATAHAQPLPPPPSMNDPGSGASQAPKKPAAKPRRAAKPAEAAAEAAKPAPKAAPQRSSVETRPLPRRIDPSDIDDPYGGVGPSQRSAPTFTPSGKIGVGGRF